MSAWLVALMLAATVHAQDPTLATTVLTDPCTAMWDALRAQGYNPVGGNPVVNALRTRAWWLLLPVLHDVARTPALATDTEALHARVVAQAGPDRRLYSPAEASGAADDIAAAAARGEWVATIWNDTAVGPLWRETIRSGAIGPTPRTRCT